MWFKIVCMDTQDDSRPCEEAFKTFIESKDWFIDIKNLEELMGFLYKHYMLLLRWEGSIPEMEI